VVIATSTTSTATTAARRFLDAIVTRDFDAMRATVASDVWMRALLPRSIVETHTAEHMVETFREWFAAHEAFKVLTTELHTVGGREFLSYNILVRPDWAPAEWHVVEQSGYCRVANDTLTRLDLVCTGYFPTSSDAAV
jgi:hypothetical protein